MIPNKLPKQNSAFTLAEVIVSSALVVGIMGLLLTTVEQTRKTINSTTSKASQFQASRVAFDAMTRNLAQATLNTYWELDRDGETRNPTGFRRQADLHFISGKAARETILESMDEATYPTHAVFFQAPLGFSAETVSNTSPIRKYAGLSNLLSVVGYYVAWGPDTNIPNFLTTQSDFYASRYRYRLMQVMQPAESLMVYNSVNYTKSDKLPGIDQSKYVNPTDWIKAALGKIAIPTGPKGKQASQRVLAENIIALIIVPKLAERDRTSKDALNDLTDDYNYDSRPMDAFNSQTRDKPPNGTIDELLNLVKKLGGDKDKRVKQLHQMPPILQVTMIAIDEPSALKLETAQANGNPSNPPAPELATGLFSKCTTMDAFHKDLGDLETPDEGSLVYNISTPNGPLKIPRLNYRVYNADVVIRGSKWSSEKIVP